MLWIGLDKPRLPNLALTASRTLNVRDEPARLAYPSLPSRTIISFEPHPRGLLDIGRSVVELLQRGLPPNANI